MTDLSIAVFEGDGIGPEIMAATMQLLEQLTRSADSYTLSFDFLPAGAGLYAKTGDALPESSVAAARTAHAILLSAMGLPDIRYPDGTEITPQIDLRFEMNLYAGVRPVRIAPGYPSPLASPGDVDFVLIRESTEGLFHTKGKGTVTEDYATETLKLTRKTSQKLCKFAFLLAQQRREMGRGPGRVTCVDKANVFRAFAWFREIFDAEASHHSELKADHAYVDAMALWMVQRPAEFDVLVTENMFGDILSDLGAGLMGGLGLAPSADIGDHHAVFQPCHGTAPDIAGRGIANPMAMILSAAMMLDWLALEKSLPELAQHGTRLREAVEDVLREGAVLTGDLGGSATTEEVADAIGAKL
ncbi:MAG: isocitrate/isopropylmalate family dehydrogenase [Dinoroseobacter sp.]|nr:isocitrate/isopropylmalate family dehydrogenase [Dinoroseobacter sp.]